MLKEKNVDHVYREYTKEPLNAQEIRQVLQALDLNVRDVLRKRDPAYKTLEPSQLEDDDALIEAMAESPTLLQRPIGVVGTLGADAKAAIGRPPENLLDLIS